MSADLPRRIALASLLVCASALGAPVAVAAPTASGGPEALALSRGTTADVAQEQPSAPEEASAPSSGSASQPASTPMPTPAATDAPTVAPTVVPTAAARADRSGRALAPQSVGSSPTGGTSGTGTASSSLPSAQSAPSAQPVHEVPGGSYQWVGADSVRYTSQAGSFVVSGAVFAEFGRRGWQDGSLGWPTSELTDAASGTKVQTFTHGAVIVTSAGVARAVWGDVYASWQRAGGLNGSLGAPVGDVEWGARGGLQRFAGGVIYWSAASGAAVVRGDVLSTYARYNWQGGQLGYPLSEEESLGSGRVLQRFAGGVIYVGPAGPAAVWGDVLAAYGRVGWQSGSLGYPTHPVQFVAGGALQRFEHGVIYWSPAYGAHAVSALLYRYGQEGWQDGIHGFPTSDEYVDRGVVRQNYARGTMWAGSMPAGVYTHSLVLAGQPNGYFCGPTSGFMALSAVGAWYSAADGGRLSVEALASPWYMNTVGYGYTSFQDRRFEYGMNRWLGRAIYHSVHTPSVETVRAAVRRSFETSYPTVIDEQERRGGPHFNGHSNSTYSHIMVVKSYDTRTDAVELADPGYTIWRGASPTFWYPSLEVLVRTHMQQEIMGDGLEHIGVFSS